MSMRPGSRILIIDDDPAFSATLARALTRRGYETATAADRQSALASTEGFDPAAAVLDLKLAEESGLSLIEPLLALNPELRILVLTGYASIPTAVETIKRGAVNYLAKPADADTILQALHGKTSATSPSRPMSPRRLEWEHIQRVLKEHDGNISATAKALGMHRRTLQRKLAKKPVKR